jgi:hypothetical protein
MADVLSNIRADVMADIMADVMADIVADIMADIRAKGRRHGRWFFPMGGLQDHRRRRRGSYCGGFGHRQIPRRGFGPGGYRNVRWDRSHPGK